jgi:putative transposase
MTTTPSFDFNAEFKKCKTAEDLMGKNGLLQRLVGPLLSEMLKAEMNQHLGYEKHAPARAV